MTTKIKTTKVQRDKIIGLLVLNKYTDANICAKFLGFTEGITAEFFEHTIAKDGLHMQVIEALAVYYADDTKTARINAGVQ